MTRLVRPLSRTTKIEQRIERGGRLTRAEKRELWATGRMIDSAAAQVQMLAEDDVFAAAMPFEVDLLKHAFAQLRRAATRAIEEAEK